MKYQSVIELINSHGERDLKILLNLPVFASLEDLIKEIKIRLQNKGIVLPS